ncbi:hypothetical protein J5N97_015897 [Dioscorea zingiberensis]|uniref:Uncharacterized protein n=1 Tax=Dioscorea zingiberensis TaxID=325984 RepID=A0A9D5CJY4_9LILI|nr:hypothetical protein J5N97_015897 [Dioscorea zingiberensis]
MAGDSSRFTFVCGFEGFKEIPFLLFVGVFLSTLNSTFYLVQQRNQQLVLNSVAQGSKCFHSSSQQQPMSSQQPGMSQPQSRQQAGSNDLQLLQQHLMYKQLQEFQRHQQLQQLNQVATEILLKENNLYFSEQGHTQDGAMIAKQGFQGNDLFVNAPNQNRISGMTPENIHQVAHQLRGFHVQENRNVEGQSDWSESVQDKIVVQTGASRVASSLDPTEGEAIVWQ